MNDIPDESVDMILCDLPYGTLGNNPPSKWNKKDEISKWDNRLNTNKLFSHYSRILRQNGKALLFCQGDYSAELIINQTNQFRFCQKAIWLKDTSGNILGCNKFLTNYFEEICVFQKPRKEDKSNNPISEIMINQLMENNKTKSEAVSLIGSTANHYFTNGMQFRIPTKEKYIILKEAGFLNIEYDVLCEMYNKYLIDRYKHLDTIFPSTFNIWELDKKQKSNVFAYKKEKGSIHPTQKPIGLLEDLVKTFSNEGDIVLDNCMGSGSTGVACINTNRNFIGIELDETYFNIAQKRILAS